MGVGKSVCVCACMYVHIHIYVCMCLCMYLCKYVVDVCYFCTQVCTCMYKYVCTMHQHHCSGVHISANPRHKEGYRRCKGATDKLCLRDATTKPVAGSFFHGKMRMINSESCEFHS